MSIRLSPPSPQDDHSTEAAAISVVIVNFNAGPHLVRCLDALAGQTFRSFEALVLDCASTDGSFEPARASRRGDGRFRFRPLGYNAGFARANNIAAGEARGRWLALLNPDAFPAPDWLEALLAGADRHPGAGLFGSTQWSAADPGILDGAGDCCHAAGIAWRAGCGRRAEPPEGDYETFGPCAAAMMVDRQGFLALGGFDERFFCYCEDVDLAFRWRLAGGRAIQVSAAQVSHVGGACSGPVSNFARYHGLRNSIWWFAKCMPGPLLPVALPLHLFLLACMLVRAAAKGHGGVTVRAIAAGMAGLPSVWRQRRAIQPARRVSAWSLAQALAWSPLALLTRPIHKLGPNA